MTVGDKIRQFNDYELADYLTRVETQIIRKRPTIDREQIYFEWLETIQKPIENDE